jgi:multiple sugar transport system permease protein
MLAGFLVPALTLVAAVSLYPVIDAFLLSLHATEFAHETAFVGLGNYVALARDPTIWLQLGTSLVYTGGSLVLVLPLSLALALLLNRPLPFRGLFRTIAILPWAVSQTITALLWAWILNPNFGIGIFALQSLLGHPVAVLSTTSGALTALILINVWASYPLAALLFLAALQTIPTEMMEAAAVDGAGAFARLYHIIWPLIKPTTLVLLIQLTLLYFNMVTLIYVLTGGGPLGATETIAVRVLKTSFEDWHLGTGAALGMVLSIVNLLFSLFYMRALKERSA